MLRHPNVYEDGSNDYSNIPFSFQLVKPNASHSLYKFLLCISRITKTILIQFDPISARPSNGGVGNEAGGGIDDGASDRAGDGVGDNTDYQTQNGNKYELVGGTLRIAHRPDLVNATLVHIWAEVAFRVFGIAGGPSSVQVSPCVFEVNIPALLPILKAFESVSCIWFRVMAEPPRLCISTSGYGRDDPFSTVRHEMPLSKLVVGSFATLREPSIATPTISFRFISVQSLAQRLHRLAKYAHHCTLSANFNGAVTFQVSAPLLSVKFSYTRQQVLDSAPSANSDMFILHSATISLGDLVKALALGLLSGEPLVIAIIPEIAIIFSQPFYHYAEPSGGVTYVVPAISD